MYLLIRGSSAWVTSSYPPLYPWEERERERVVSDGDGEARALVTYVGVHGMVTQQKLPRRRAVGEGGLKVSELLLGILLR